MMVGSVALVRVHWLVPRPNPAELLGTQSGSAYEGL
jgi:hypothetical protein